MVLVVARRERLVTAARLVPRGGGGQALVLCRGLVCSLLLPLHRARCKELRDGNRCPAGTTRPKSHWRWRSARLNQSIESASTQPCQRKYSWKSELRGRDVDYLNRLGRLSAQLRARGRSGRYQLHVVLHQDRLCAEWLQFKGHGLHEFLWHT